MMICLLDTCFLVSSIDGRKKKTKEMGATDEKWTEMSDGEIHWPHFRNYEIILKL